MYFYRTFERKKQRLVFIANMKSFFKNKIVNLLNVHSGLHRFSNNIFDVFGAVYLLELGLSYPTVAFAWVGSMLIRFLVRPLSILLSQKIGLKRSIIFGVLVNSGIFFALSKVTGINGWLVFYMVYLALCDIFYWLPYHSYYSTAGDNADRGKQVGVLFGLVTLLSMVAPLIGGILISQFGFSTLYIFATSVMLVSLVPVFFLPDLSPGSTMTFKNAFKSIDKRGLVMQMGEGFMNMHIFVWTIALFYLIGNYETFGLLVTIQLLATSIIFMILGHYLDKGKGRKIMMIGTFLMAVVVILRALFVTTILEVIFVDVIFALASTFFWSSFGVGLYTIAKNTPNTLWFHFFAECGWDIGAGVSIAVSATLFILGVPLKLVILFSLLGLLIVFKVFNNFYNKPESIN